MGNKSLSLPSYFKIFLWEEIEMIHMNRLPMWKTSLLVSFQKKVPIEKQEWSALSVKKKKKKGLKKTYAILQGKKNHHSSGAKCTHVQYKREWCEGEERGF